MTRRFMIRWLMVLMLSFALTSTVQAESSRSTKTDNKKKKSKKSKNKKKESKKKSKAIKHEVIPGETLGSIAKRYGVTVKQIKKWNKLKSDTIRVGQKLTIYPKVVPQARSKKIHIVKKGETLGKIAKKYKVSVDDLKKWNRGIKPDKLKIGQEIVIYVDGPIKRSNSVGKPNKGRLVNGIQLQPGVGFSVRSSKYAWGTDLTIREINQGFAKMKRKYPNAPDVLIADLSSRKGGRLKDHKSHQSGRDADIVFYQKNGTANRFKKTTTKTLDVKKQWALFHIFISSGHVDFIFVDYGLQKVLYQEAKKRGATDGYLDEVFQYPKGKHHRSGIIRHEPGHADHFHIRFGCSSDDSRCQK